MGRIIGRMFALRFERLIFRGRAEQILLYVDDSLSSLLLDT